MSRIMLQIVELLLIVLVLVTPFMINSCTQVEYVERPLYTSRIPPGDDDLQMEDCNQYHNKPELNCDMGLSI